MATAASSVHKLIVSVANVVQDSLDAYLLDSVALVLAVAADPAASLARVADVLADPDALEADPAAALAELAALAAEVDASLALVVAVDAEPAAFAAEVLASVARVLAVLAEVVAAVAELADAAALLALLVALVDAFCAWVLAEYSVEPETVPPVLLAHSWATAAPDCASLSR